MFYWGPIAGYRGQVQVAEPATRGHRVSLYFISTTCAALAD